VGDLQPDPPGAALGLEEHGDEPFGLVGPIPLIRHRPARVGERAFQIAVFEQNGAGIHAAGGYNRRQTTGSEKAGTTAGARSHDPGDGLDPAE
jgi:hypothetical protein